MKKQMQKKEKGILRETKGITLIALVITIVVLIILALISISMVFGENGIMDRATDVAERDAAAKLEEELKLKLLDSQISSIIDENFDIGILENMLKGVYSQTVTIDYEKEDATMNADVIMEYEGKYFRCNIIIQESGSINIQNTKMVKTVDPMAEALYLFMENPEAVEIIDEKYYAGIDIIGIKYKEVIYDVVDSNVDPYTYKIYIEPREETDISTLKWKNAFTADSEAITIDTNNNVWLWDVTNDVYDIANMEPIQLSKRIPLLKDIEIENIITDSSNFKIIGYIDTNGKIYMIYEEMGYLICLNDMFSEQLEDLVAKEAVITYQYNKELVILDKNGKLWVITEGHSYKDINVRKLSNEISELNNIIFTKIVVNNSNQMTRDLATTSIIGLDTNKKVWRVDVPHYIDDILNAECISNTKNLPLINDIVSDEYNENSMLIGEDNILYEYNMYPYSEKEIYPSSEREDTKNIKIKKYYGGKILDINGNVWTYPEYNSERTAEQININGALDNKKVQDIYGYRNKFGHIIDVEGNIWKQIYNWENEISTYEKILSFNGKEIKKICANSVILIIDVDGNLYRHGKFWYEQ